MHLLACSLRHLAKLFDQLLRQTQNSTNNALNILRVPIFYPGDLFPNQGKLPLIGGPLLRQVPTGEYEELYGSPLLEALAATDGERDGARFTSIYSEAFDGIVEPRDSPFLPGARNIPLVDDKKIFGLPRHNNHLTITQASVDAYENMRAALIEGLDAANLPAYSNAQEVARKIEQQINFLTDLVAR